MPVSSSRLRVATVVRWSVTRTSPQTKLIIGQVLYEILKIDMGKKLGIKQLIGISLFSGAGGLDLGATKAGLKIRQCIEFDPDSCETLRINHQFSNVEILEEDIREVDFTAQKEKLPSKGIDKRIVIGGPPCQPFSKNSYWVKNENRNVDRDPRNLISEFIRCVDEIEADAFILENVESIKHPTNKHMIDFIMAAGESMNYGVSYFTLNAADYGVPQKRKRVFFVGIKNSKPITEIPLKTHTSANSKDLFSNLPTHLGVGEFIKPFEGNEFFESQEDASNGTYFEELKNVPPGNNYTTLSKLQNYQGRTFKSGSRFWNFLFKLHTENPSITIAAQPGPWVGPFHWTNRRLRVPEIAAIQTFPKNYKFYGNRRSVQKQIGNAVPSLLGHHVTNFLMERL